MSTQFCPECNCDRFKCTDYDKLLKEISEISLRFKKASADQGRERAEWEIDRIRLEESAKHLQSKTRRQSKAITRLEAKLKSLGQQPYKEDEPDFVIRNTAGQKIVCKDMSPTKVTGTNFNVIGTDINE